MTPSETFARMLLTKARADLAAAIALSAMDSMDDDVVGFHCQQAVEKALKAVLANSDVDFPKTHDLAELSDLVTGIPLDQPVAANDIGYMAPWAVELRYDMPSDQRLDRQRVLGAAKLAVEWAAERMPE